MLPGGAPPAPDRRRSPTAVSTATPSPADQALAYARDLVDATCAIAAGADDGPEGPLDTLIEQVGRLLPVDARVLTCRSGTAELVEHRPAAARRGAEPSPDVQPPARLDPLARAAIDLRGAVVARGAPAALAAPLAAAGELIGLLDLRWRTVD